MLFNSYEFIFVFCPIVYSVFFLLGNTSRQAALLWLTFASFFFYGWWNPKYLILMCISMLVNYGIGYRLIKENQKKGSHKKPKIILTIGICFNLALLCYYKYAHFLISQLSKVIDISLQLEPITLPLGISFFTFVQIAFLVDAYRKETDDYRLPEYALFVTYFPHLIAGPIIHHRDVIPLFKNKETYRARFDVISVGLTIFCFGLFKKTVLADKVALYVSPVFDSPQTFSFFETWSALLAYTLQIYFDFSGYSDMAIGLSKAIGIPLPANFFSPYKSKNIIEFWRRWHMSLSRFLRDYLYIPLGGNRKGSVRRYINLMITMILGGFWHGAGWTFIIWGFLHGLYLVINHGWRSLNVNIHRMIRPIWDMGSRTLTFVAVMFAWIFFRAPDLGQARKIIWSLIGKNGISVNSAILQKFPALTGYGFTGEGFFPRITELRYEGKLWILGLLAIALFAPNTLQITRRFEPALDIHDLNKPARTEKFWNWNPSPKWALAISALFIVGVLHIYKGSVFLYFQF